MKPTRNSVVLADFVAYCEAHPHERFWQALCNWTAYAFIYASNTAPWVFEQEMIEDTFSWEGKNS